MSVGGTVLAAVAAGVQIDAQSEPAASALLRMLGLNHTEAEEIAHRPLPEMRGNSEALSPDIPMVRNAYRPPALGACRSGTHL
ncbi:hypothetical protein ACPCHQ_07270 [Ralstonia thomasii]|uniref:hypothetical protein n=1 Tax=Ralstonia TaxID=48736 RepID=UPI003328AE1C